MTDGVIYMTWGMNAINQAENSITTLRRKAGSDYPVMVVGDAEAQAYFSDKKHVRFELIEVNPFNEQKSRGFSLWQDGSSLYWLV